MAALIGFTGLTATLFASLLHDMQVPRSQRGDLLIFVAGMGDIVALLEALRAYAQQSPRWIVLPLHSALSAEDQDKVRGVPNGISRAII